MEIWGSQLLRGGVFHALALAIEQDLSYAWSLNFQTWTDEVTNPDWNDEGYWSYYAFRSPEFLLISRRHVVTFQEFVVGLKKPSWRFDLMGTRVFVAELTGKA